jgi:hypothetical protein
MKASLIALDQLQVGDVELHLAVEPADRCVEVIAVAGAVVGERPEHLGMQLGDTVEDLCLDVVHLHEVGQLHQVALHRALLELGERLLHLGAVVRLPLVPADRDFRPVAAHRVTHPGERVLERLRLGRQRGKALRGGVVGKVVAKRLQAAGGHVALCQVCCQRADGPAVDLDRIQEPRLLLQWVVELLCLGEVLPHLLGRLGERRDRLVHVGLLEVAQHLVAVAHGCGLMQRRVEERLELVLLPTGGHRPKHLIEIQIDEEVRLLQPLDSRCSLRLPEEDAVKSRGARTRRRLGTGRRTIRRERRARSTTIRSRHQLPPVSCGRSHQPVAAVQAGFIASEDRTGHVRRRVALRRARSSSPPGSCLRGSAAASRGGDAARSVSGRRGPARAGGRRGHPRDAPSASSTGGRRSAPAASGRARRAPARPLADRVTVHHASSSSARANAARVWSSA